MVNNLSSKKCRKSERRDDIIDIVILAKLVEVIIPTILCLFVKLVGIDHFFLQVTSFIIKMTISPMIKLMFLLPFASQTRCFLIVSNSKLASLKIFRRDVPIRKLGRV